MKAIEISNLYKKIKGKTILNNINLSLEEGGIYGFYGENGSGKSMLFRAISGIIKPTSGLVTVFSKTIGQDISFPEDMGLIIETVGFWSFYNGFENLKTLASIKNKIDATHINNTILRVGLNPKNKISYGKYSLGMKQRLGIAQAIMEKPKLIILDEPTNALDYDGIELIRNIIIEEKERGATILVASHNKDDLSLLCDRFFRMKDGTLEETKNICK